MKSKCAICGKAVSEKGEDFPFCSDRCRMIDLGKWISGDYVISTPAPHLSEAASQEDEE